PATGCTVQVTGAGGPCGKMGKGGTALLRPRASIGIDEKRSVGRGRRHAGPGPPRTAGGDHRNGPAGRPHGRAPCPAPGRPFAKGAVAVLYGEPETARFLAAVQRLKKQQRRKEQQTRLAKQRVRAALRKIREC